ncbi:MAG: DUF2752 domain-containing protein [Ruminococcaceae bacterium]|nr:DUF2752 domain-containing protein [Oscillospiraceae bacterium]
MQVPHTIINIMKYIQNKRLLVILFDALIVAVGFCIKPMAIFMFQTGISQCSYYKNGIICPGCGGTRCVYNFFSGNLYQSFVFHPFVFCMIWYCFLVILLLNLEFIFKSKIAKRIRRFLLDYRTIIVLFICFVIFGLSRNFIPFINPFPKL